MEFANGGKRMATLLEQLDAMRNLEANWDGYNADPILPQALDLAKELVSYMESTLPEEARQTMFVAPSRDGSVLIEWSDAAYEHELGIEIDGSLEFLHIEKHSGVMVSEKYPSEGQAIHPGVLRELRGLIAV